VSLSLEHVFLLKKDCYFNQKDFDGFDFSGTGCGLTEKCQIIVISLKVYILKYF
jgi:hypothetical protein